MSVFASPGTMELHLLPRDVMRVDRYFTRIPIVTEHEKLGSVAAHIYGFGNYLGRANTFNHSIGAVSACQLTYALDSALGRRELLDIQALGSTEPSRGFQ